MEDKEVSFSDINPFNIRPSNSESVQNENNNNGNSKKNGDSDEELPKPKVKFNPRDYYYEMTGEKILVVINNYTFKKTRYYNYAPPDARTGTDRDERSLRRIFQKLGFKVIVHRDKDYADIWKIFSSMRKADYSAVSCLSVAIMTHGMNDGLLCAADRAYNLKDVVKLFEDHPTLANKPKLFFIQACRGKNSDAGTSVVIDGPGDREENIFVTPSHADFLVMRSTVEDYRSYRDYRGSWMMQELCKTLAEHYEYLDILQMVTLVHKQVAYEYFTNTPDDHSTHYKKQMPETNFTLTKLLKF